MMEQIRVEPQPIKPGERARVRYNGLLAHSGAEMVYLHAGFSSSHDWNEVNDIEMHYDDNAWTTEVEIRNADKLNFCFKDSANNWDNNNGHNWSYEIL